MPERLASSPKLPSRRVRPRGRAALLRLLWIVGALLWPSLASAQRVLLAPPPARDEVLFEAFGRLRAELELQSFQVVVLTGKPPTADDLEDIAQEQDAFAALALQRDREGTAAKVYIVDRVTGKTTTRKLRIEPSADGPTLLAVRAVDLLRASLLELEPGERPKRDVMGTRGAPVAPEVVRFSRRETNWDTRAGGVALLSAPLGVGAGLLMSASYRVNGRLQLGLVAAGPAFGAQLSVSRGRATVRQELAWARAAANILRPQRGSRWELGPLLCAGVHHLSATGVVEPPLVGQTKSAWSAAVSGGLTLSYFFDDTLSAGLDASTLLLLPSPVVAVDQERAAPLALQGLLALTMGASF